MWNGIRIMLMDKIQDCDDANLHFFVRLLPQHNDRVLAVHGHLKSIWKWSFKAFCNMKSTCSQGQRFQCMFSWLSLSVLSKLRFCNFYFKPWQTFVDWGNAWNRCHLRSSPRTPYHWALSPSPEDHTPWLRRNEIRVFPVVPGCAKNKKRFPKFGVACLSRVE